LFLWRIGHCKKIGFIDSSRINYRVLPLDCDINLHLTNSRYPAFFDLARTYLIAEIGLMKPFIKNKWFPIVNAAEFTYIRDIKPFEKFTIETKIVGWDEKYFYIEHRILTDRGLHCIAHVRGVFMCRGKQVPIETLITAAGYTNGAPEMPAEVIKWKQFLQLKKQRNI
jgi:acyl-CoA thioesterase FadM